MITKKMFTPLLLSVCMLLVSGATESAQAAAKKDIVDTAVAAGSFKTLAAALGAADLVEALKGEGPFTVFAPTDEAFAKLPKGTVANLLKPENKKQLIAVLTYHVVAGDVKAKTVVKLNSADTLNGQRVAIKVSDGKVKVDNSTVVKTDIKCSNGTIHVIDQVLLPSGDNIPTVAVKAGKFKTLVAAVKAAGLLETLSGKGPFTVFAPTDEAFAKLPAGTVESLLKPANRSKLVAILKYHVVAGRVYSDDALKAGAAATLQGGKVTIAIDGKNARVNNATLLATDIAAANGVIHVIDSVLLPPKNAKTSQRPGAIMERAVAKGSHLYNNGDAAECADVYTKTMRTMLTSKRHDLPHHAVRAMEMALYRARRSDCSESRAWILRRGMDSAYSAMMSNYRGSPAK